MAAKLIYHLTGMGLVREKDGPDVGQAEYDIRVWQRYADARHSTGGGYLPVLKEIQGEVSGINTNALCRSRAKLELTLEDGRRLDFQVQGNGEIIPKGGLV